MGEVPKLGNELYKRTWDMMGTFVSVTIVAGDAKEACRIINLAFKEMYRLSNLLSVYNEASEVSTLNTYGYCRAASPETIEILKKALCFCEITEGAFDITVLPVLKVWKESARVGRSPSDFEIAKALELVNYRSINVEGNNIRFARAGMGIDLGGVAKGYVIDKGIEVLSCAGVARALIDGGGDIRVIGGTKETPWRIGVRNPTNRRSLIAILELCSQAVATSSPYRRKVKDIIDPRSGRPVRGILSSTVVADKLAEADALATCMLVLGMEKGMELVESLRNVAALVVTEEGLVVRSSRWQEITRR